MIKKRSVTLPGGHKTSVTLEDVFWDALKEMAAARGQSISKVVSDMPRPEGLGRSSAIRVMLMETLQGNG